MDSLLGYNIITHNGNVVKILSVYDKDSYTIETVYLGNYETPLSNLSVVYIDLYCKIVPKDTCWKKEIIKWNLTK
jgi:hypothetical protein